MSEGYLTDRKGTHLRFEGRTPAQTDLARKIVVTLYAAYPGYSWNVRVDGTETGGLIAINILDSFCNPGARMVCAYSGNESNYYSSSAMLRDVIMKGGEYLERAGRSRAHFQDEAITRIEGLPERFQGPSEKPPLDAVTLETNSDIRTEPRPQVLNHG